MSNEWEAKAAITEVINRYSGAAGRLDIKAIMAFFTPDAELHGVASILGKPEPLKGAEQSTAFFAPLFDSLEWLLQMNTTTDITLSADQTFATASTGLIERAKRKNAAGMVVLTARYDDELVLTEKGWQFTKRRLTPMRFEQVE
jgi:ketosteroid isomerase-like protein